MRLLRTLSLLVPAAVLAAGCAAPGSAPPADDGDSRTVRIGVSDGAEPYWNVFTEKAAAEGITVELVNFTDYNQPNPALSQGQLDLNQFQHLQYLANYNVQNDDTLTPIGATAVYPLPLYSTRHSDLAQIPDGGQIVVPNDAVNQARALNVLQSAGLLTLTDGGTTTSTPADIDQAASRVSVTPVDAAQTAANLPSADGAIVNNNYATSANLTSDQVLYQEDPDSDAAKPYINLFVARAEQAQDPDLATLVRIYHDQEVLDAARKDLGDDGVFRDNTPEDLQQTLAGIEQQLRAG
ncbi:MULTISPECIES: MetQ/NlpA family ABC transporter substrate-binding protein [Pseudonocardia]|uniref:ABC-type transporter, periplasmic component n=2 Tax=Pseudonocardia TaxID=1847 RepID=A0ABQ0S1A1_9PSEU|nr:MULTISPECIES: MetQ/NlpA family ABC transporter substrate-binding protein [Pseudonocardia]OSY38510.1 putative D-methionine-binding lipoprotein MetQ precursor [Pseudonocardia autotrophica]TDN77047.1 D-methionine transport system substrate-binding protein [Pseudonocardia autotrophica]BBG01053.1 putative ABC-type transporter, periplasmic component [Pseudonocardia autotrophica]GEC26681.1 putative ABC-type transporter, periplasmic component [Pseudonocardia saturnea]